MHDVGNTQINKYKLVIYNTLFVKVKQIQMR